jgi:hypothetical protein
VEIRWIGVNKVDHAFFAVVELSVHLPLTDGYKYWAKLSKSKTLREERLRKRKPCFLTI